MVRREELCPFREAEGVVADSYEDIIIKPFFMKHILHYTRSS
jgi:hypothetical protein